jgi:hypothetical protein
MQFAEPIEGLMGRFRRVEVTLGNAEPDLLSPPGGWLELERMGNQVRFVDSHYSPDAFESYRSERFQDSEAILSPMKLRDIFVTLAKSNREKATSGAL